MSSEVDDTDLRLLGLLRRDGLQSMAELSKAIGVALATVLKQVKGLQHTETTITLSSPEGTSMLPTAG